MKKWNTYLNLDSLHGYRLIGTRLAEKGVSINVIKEILAHSDIRTTMKYVHLVEGSKKAAIHSHAG